MIERPKQHGEFAKLRRKIRADRRKGIKPSLEDVHKLRLLDKWLSINTKYWRRNYDPAGLEIIEDKLAKKK